MSFTVDTVEENNTLNNLLYLESLIDHCPVITQDFTDTLSPYEALQLLKEGNARFVADNSEDSIYNKFLQISKNEAVARVTQAVEEVRSNKATLFNQEEYANDMNKFMKSL